MSAKVSLNNESLEAANTLLASWREGNMWKRLENRGYYTPDWCDLRMHSQMLYFAYGEEKLTYTHDHLLKGAVPLGPAHTLIAKYVMKEDHYGPIVFEKKEVNYFGTQQIKGEAYLVSVEHLHCLDTHYLNTVMAKRVWRNFGFDSPYVDGMTSERFKGKPRGCGWMYIADEVALNFDSYKTMTTEVDLTLTQSEQERYYYIW